MDQPSIIVVNLGSQYTHVIERTLRELGFRSAVLSPEKAEQWIKGSRPRAIILSGGLDSVYNPGAPTVSLQVLELGVPILGICYGMQLIVHTFGGKVIASPSESEYGPAHIQTREKELFSGIQETSEVWASHGDSVTEVPPRFTVIAKSERHELIAAIRDEERRMWGVSFHPEVPETVFGKRILENFLHHIANCQKDWQPKDMVSEIQHSILATTGGQSSILAFSGGVDSTTLAALSSPVLGGKLKAVCIDGGQLREGEIEEIRANAEAANVTLQVVNARKRFEDLWQTDTFPDPELKRKLFRKAYQDILAETAQRLGAAFFLQGTLATDMIESGMMGGDCIKTHHNTGAMLPGCKSVHPISHLFKYEVRALAENIELPKTVTKRQPFPGPGLFIRIVGGWPTTLRLAIVCWADKEVTKILKEDAVYDDLSQLVVALDSTKFVGVKGDRRVYEYPILVRAVKTSDFMTAKGVRFSEKTWNAIMSTLTKHKNIVTVLQDEAPKPPRTVEFE